MKVWKIMVVVGFVLLVAALAVTLNYALEDKDIRAAKARIENYRVVAEEQRLIRQILEDKITVAKIQASLAPKKPVDPNSP